MSFYLGRSPTHPTHQTRLDLDQTLHHYLVQDLNPVTTIEENMTRFIIWEERREIWQEEQRRN